jgi:hypothetical protein
MTPTTTTYVEQGKAFDRDMSYVPDRITKDGRRPERDRSTVSCGRSSPAATG